MKEKTKKNMGAIIGGAVGFAIAFMISFNFFGGSVDQKLVDASEEINATLPMQVDAYTRLDSTNTSGKEAIYYYYTLLETSLSEVNYDTVNKYLRPQIINDVKTNPKLKWFRNKNIIMGYRYYDKYGKHVLDIDVTPEMYNKEHNSN